MDYDTYQPNIDIIPRTPDILPPGEEVKRPPWNFAESVFGDY